MSTTVDLNDTIQRVLRELHPDNRDVRFLDETKIRNSKTVRSFVGVVRAPHEELWRKLEQAGVPFVGTESTSNGSTEDRGHKLSVITLDGQVEQDWFTREWERCRVFIAIVMTVAFILAGISDVNDRMNRAARN